MLSIGTVRPPESIEKVHYDSLAVMVSDLSTL